jgi:uncharacterized membrane protein
VSRHGSALVLVLLVAVPPAAAQQPVHQVTGVAASDVLTVRRAPSASAPAIGALSPLADFVLVRERRGSWVRVEVTRGVPAPVRGWVAGRYLEPVDIDARPDDGAWACYGTEPFWSAWIEGGEVAFRTDDGTTTTRLADLRPSRNEPGRAWTFRFGGDAPQQAVMMSGGVCSDGMSDVTTRRSLALVGPGGGLLNGCCRRPVADERPPESHQP